MYSVQEQQYLHYDTARGSNDVIAEKLAKQLGK